MVRNYIEWYRLNIEALVSSGYFNPNDINFISQDNPVLEIIKFRLPENFMQKFSRLLIVFPRKHSIFTIKPDRFYLNKGLTLRKGKKPGHIFDNAGFNDLSKYGWARYSFHLKKWCPKYDVIAGSTVYDLLEGVYEGLQQL